MRLLNRYICRTVLGTTLVVIIALISMDFFIQLMNEIDDLGRGNYGIMQALIFVLMELPRDVYQLFPMAGLIGCLMGLGLLASSSELVVMRASGVSLAQITRAVFIAILIMVAVVTFLGEAVGPRAMLYGEQLKALARSGGQALATRNGLWLRDGADFVRIQTVQTAKVLDNVTRYSFNEQHQMTKMIYAAHARYENGAWSLDDVKETDVALNGTVTSKTAPTGVWHMQLNPAVLKITQIDPDEMTLSKLYQWIEYRKANGLRYNNYALTFWQRIFQPLATCVMMLLAIPFIFGPLRSATMGLRLVAGVIVGFSFYILNQLFGPISLVYQLPPILAAIIPMTLFACIGVLFIRRMG
ncbi:MAG: LPS export ABC transporter permease LptG [Gammaproteobacteria bacterium]|nr:LPS export ABC transporter permease LptG [Gammaproteobacteria bacterium]